MKRKTWSSSQRKNYNNTIRKRQTDNFIMNAAISFCLFCVGCLWRIPKNIWKGIKWIYNKVVKKEDNASL